MNRENNREKWREQVRRWKDGGLTARQFASEMGLNYHTLLYWNSRLRHEQDSTNGTTELEPSAHFIELTEALKGKSPVAVEPVIELLVSGVMIRVPVGFDEQTLRRVLSVIRQP